MRQFAFLKMCNHFPEKIFSHDGVDYYASDEDSAFTFRGNLVVNLTREAGVRASSTAYNIPELKDHLISLPEEIVLGWIDFSKPPVKCSFWEGLHSYCKSKKFTQVLFHCQQGHGRTGTALAAMLVSLKKKSAPNAIKEVRMNHCKLAVESDRQIEYLLLLDNELNGRLLPETDEEAQALITSLETSKKVVL